MYFLHIIKNLIFSMFCLKNGHIRKFNLFRICRKFSNIAGKVFVSGIQATGTPHIGNYLGFIQSWVNCQQVSCLKIFFD